MNISYKWLKEYVDFDMTPEEVSEALTSIGLEVEGLEEIQAIRGGLEGIVVGEVLTCEEHPDSDHMHVCMVNIGTNDIQQIVCGAPNIAAGQKVMVATLGTVLYDGEKEFVIKKSKLRGVPSNGMICAEDEIGVGSSHDGIIVLPADVVPGTKAAEYYHLESDYLIEIGITPNRADACSHYGVARDLYAYMVQNGMKTALKKPSCDGFNVDNNNLSININVDDTLACPRYAAVSIKGVTVKESPEWLKTKLNVIGLRPINNIVDITNYIMMAYGQPLHCFDADMIEGGEIIVKTMPEGTKFVTLDGVEHTLSKHDLAICNAKEAMCIAGVFGGKGSGTYETTCNVLLESAYFNPTNIRKSARRHGLNTDASFRFERGIDPEGQIYALKQAAMLVKELAGGEISMEIADIICKETLPKNARVKLQYSYVNRLIGKEIPKETVKSIITSLEMEIYNETEDAIELIIPAYRVDVTRPCDVVEDILRIYGYNNIDIPTSVNSCLSVKNDTDRSFKLQNIVSEQLVGCGFNEILNNSLSRIAYYDGFTESFKAENCVKILNPLSQDLAVMRQTLFFGGMESIARNINHKSQNLSFFEFGNCYYYNEAKKCANIVPGVSSSRDPEVIKHILDAYSEDYHLGIWMTGKLCDGSWLQQSEDVTFYHLKAHVMNILQRTGLQMSGTVWSKSSRDIFSTGIEIQNRGGKVIAMMGQVSKKVAHTLGIDQTVYYADINWKNLMNAVKTIKVTYKEISKFPAVSRDLALLLDKNVEFSQIEQIAYSADKKLVREIRLFDVYEGKNLPEGKKSYAINIILQDDSKTLTDKQIEAVMQKIINNLKSKLGAELR